jgi:ATP-dependent Clp protease ATP-binding subunit ClpA
MAPSGLSPSTRATPTKIAAVDVTVTAALANEGYDPQFGARPLKRVIQQRIENGLAGKILAGEIGDGDSVRVDYQGKSFVFTRVSAVAPAGAPET